MNVKLQTFKFQECTLQGTTSQRRSSKGVETEKTFHYAKARVLFLGAGRRIPLCAAGWSGGSCFLKKKKKQSCEEINSG